MKRILCPAAMATAVAMALPGGATASAFCEIPQTSDGFVALRSGPSTSSPIAARMRAGDEVMILGDSPQRGRWLQVRWWKGQDRHDKGFTHSSGSGWVHRSLLQDCG